MQAGFRPLPLLPPVQHGRAVAHGNHAVRQAALAVDRVRPVQALRHRAAGRQLFVNTSGLQRRARAGHAFPVHLFHHRRLHQVAFVFRPLAEHGRLCHVVRRPHLPRAQLGDEVFRAPRLILAVRFLHLSAVDARVLAHVLADFVVEVVRRAGALVAELVQVEGIFRPVLRIIGIDGSCALCYTGATT